jgi:hypothetical membrane protein
VRLRANPPLALGLSLAAVYLVLAGIAAMHYPHPYWPLREWLSDLGNRRVNPDGAVFYRIGSAAGGLGTIGFFAGLTVRHGAATTLKPALVTMQLLGALAGVAFIMTGVYPADMWPIHFAWSTVVFLSFGLSLIVSLFVFPNPRRSYRALTPLAIFCSLCVVAGEFVRISWLEWVTLGGFLAYVGVFGILKKV